MPHFTNLYRPASARKFNTGYHKNHAMSHPTLLSFHPPQHKLRRSPHSLATQKPILALIRQALRLALLLALPLLQARLALIIAHCTLPLRVVPLRFLCLLRGRLEDVRCAPAADVLARGGFASGLTVV